MKISFKMRIVIPVVLLVCVAFLVSNLLVFSSVKKEVKTVAQENALQQLEKYSYEIKSRLEAGIQVSKTMADFAESITKDGGNLSPESIMNILITILRTNPQLSDAWIVWEPDEYNDTISDKGSESYVNKRYFAPMAYRNGDKIAKYYAESMESTDGKSDWYQVPLKTGKITISEPTEFNIEGKIFKLSTISVPIKVNGKIIGVAGVDIGMDFLIGLINKIKLYETGYAFLFSNKFYVLAHPVENIIGRYGRDNYEAAYQNSRLLKNYFITTLSEKTGVESRIIMHPFQINETDSIFTIASVVPEKEILAFLVAIKLKAIVVTFISVIIISLLVFWIVARLVTKLGGEPDHVIELMSHISKGDFTREIKVAANDNFSLMYSVKMMVNELRILLRQVIENAGSLRDTSTNLSSGANELSAGTISQSESSTQIASATAEMTQTTHAIAQNLSDISVYSSETAEKATHSKESVHESTNGVLKIKDTVDASSALVQELSVSSEQIIEIVSVISDIADQTNLLALNAAIEAARAGDQGRGFAVVADEVRKLAERTQTATTEISELVNSTQKGIKNVTASMSDVKVNVDMGVKMSQQVAESLDVIVESVNSLEEMVSSISSATSEMASTSGQIQMDIDAVATVSEEITMTANHIAESSSNLEKMSDNMRDLVKQFKI